MEPLTVKELKRILEDWPDYTDTGELAEVWVTTEGFYSCQAIEAVRLGAGDLLIDW
jgi:hypothetical protein